MEADGDVFHEVIVGEVLEDGGDIASGGEVFEGIVEACAVVVEECDAADKEGDLSVASIVFVEDDSGEAGALEAGVGGFGGGVEPVVDDGVGVVGPIFEVVGVDGGEGEGKGEEFVCGVGHGLSEGEVEVLLGSEEGFAGEGAVVGTADVADIGDEVLGCVQVEDIAEVVGFEWEGCEGGGVGVDGQAEGVVVALGHVSAPCKVGM